MTDSKVVDFQSRLKERLDEEETYFKKMDCAHQCTPVLARAIQEMRAIGADSQIIANILQVAVEELRSCGKPRSPHRY